MDAESTQRSMTSFEWDQQRLSMRNREAALTMWTGLGAILSLLLTCFLGSLWRTEERTAFSVILMLVLLIVSVILFFTAAKRDERWNVVCSLINHAGIGLAVLILLDVLGLDIRLRQLAMSGLPAAAILFGIVMIYVGMEEQNRKNLLYVGAAVFGLAVLVSLYQFYHLRTEFWLCTAVCALLSCVNLGALIWSAAAPEERSAYRGLAVASFAIYLLLAVAALIAFALAILSSSNRDSKSTKKLFSWSKSRKSSGSGSIGVGSSSAGSGSVRSSGFGTGYPSRRRSYVPSYLWYYGLYHGFGRSRTDSAAGPMTEEERLAEKARLRRRRWIVFGLVAAIVILVIVLAVIFGRG